MDAKIQQQLLDRSSDFIDKASQALGSTGQHVYEVLVRQQMIQGIGGIISLVVFLTLAIVPSLYLFKWAYKRHQKDRYSEAYLGATFVSLIILLVAAIVAGVLQDSVQHILNPEYYAISMIFDTIKGGK